MTTANTGTIPPTLVAIATYRRPAMLRHLLESLDSVISAHRVIVVDNDAERSAEGVVAEFVGVEYMHEERPGIVAARNHALGAWSGEELIAFVDDDEWVADDWLPNLYNAMMSYSADIVVGPVIPVFPAGAPSWATDGEYFQRKRSASGTSLRDAPTNNTLAKSAVIFDLDPPRFDDRFSETGGSDTELFTRAKAAGAVICWSDDAVAWEYVPRSRLTRAWVVQRQRRLGNVRGRIAALKHSKIRVAALGLGYLGYSSMRLVAVWMLHRRIDSFGFMRYWRGIGILESLRGKFVREYARTQS